MTDVQLTARVSRRGFLAAAGAGLAAALAADAAAQQPAAQGGQTAQGAQSGQGNLFEMDQAQYRPVRLAPKSARPVLSERERDDLEHRIHCQCGCTLDVYTCRTTDFACQVSPAMHRDVMSLVAGGYDAGEIVDAFVRVYGERVLMQPTKQGFNWAGYIVPFVALGTGAVVVVTLLRRWGADSRGPAPVVALPVDATPDELARLQAALRDDAR